MFTTTPREILVPPEAPKGSEVTIAPADEPGPRFVMSGRMLDSHGAPLGGLNVYVYHADGHGWYAPPSSKVKWPRLHGVLRTDRDGRYRVRSVFPGRYGFQPHVHFVVWGKGLPRIGLTVNVRPPREDRDSSQAPCRRRVRAGRCSQPAIRAGCSRSSMTSWCRRLLQPESGGEGSSPDGA